MSKIADNPYPGSRAFQQADQGLFYGRSADAATIIDRWTTNRLTVVTGPVASGKTSLLHAGVYPLMPAKQSSILPVGSLFHGATFPFAALPDHNPFTFGLLRSWSPDDVPTRLAGLTISDFVRRLAPGDAGVTYAAIDQLDGLFLDPLPGPHAWWRQQFFAELTQACADHPRLHLLLVARSESVDQLTAAVGGGARHAIAGLTAEEAVEAITRPALGAGRHFTDDAAASLIDDLLTTRIAGFRDERPLVASHVEPSLLQAVCRQLWVDLPASVSEISAWAIREFSDADMALAAHCGQVLGQVAAEYPEDNVSFKDSFRRLRSWLLDNFVTDSGTRGAAYQGGRDTAGQPNAVPRNLLDRHLLTVDTDETVRRYRLLATRLIEPLRITHVNHSTAPTAAEYLAAAERDLAHGELDFAADHADGALGLASSLLERAQAESLLGNVAHRQGRPDEAFPHYKEAASLLQAAGDTNAAAYQLAAAGQSLLPGEHAADALPELQAAVERVPNDLRLQTQLALALWQLGEGRAAVGILSWVLSIDGEYAEARRARGEILAYLGDARSAMQDLGRDVPDRPSTRAARGLALAELGDHTAATNEINDAVANAQRNGPVLLYAARAFDLTGDKASARERAREAIDATDPPLSRPHRKQAEELARHG
ncbi:MAG: tetratricopeptide repeat protein [Trebonia sp.]